MNFLKRLNKLNLFLTCLWMTCLGVFIIIDIKDVVILSGYGFLSGYWLSNLLYDVILELKDESYEVLKNTIPTKEQLHKERLDALKFKFPLGTKVITKTNAKDKYKRGEITGYYQHHAGEVFPLVTHLGEDKRMMIMGICRKSDERRNKALDKLNGIEQWNVLAENYVIGEK